MFTAIISRIKASLQAATQSNRVVYLELYEALKNEIESGNIPEGSQMPPTRSLSDSLGLSRSTVVKAYNLLTENKLLNSLQGSGFFIAEAAKSNEADVVNHTGYPAISELGQSFLENIHILNNPSIQGVAFMPGLPPLDIFPIGQWQKLSNLYWRNIKSSELNQSTSSGLKSLKDNIVRYLLLSRKIKCEPSQVVIVSGSLQSLYLVGNVLIDKDDVVYMENPTFPNVISIFKSLRAHVVPVGIDNEGILVENMTEVPDKKTKLVHVTPSHQYPLGGKMSLERRLQLIEWANKQRAMIIENDYEHEINNWTNPVDSIFSLDQHKRTIFLGTFNRSLHPSIRLGYMILPQYLIDPIKTLQMHSHRFVPQSIQSVMSDFITKNLIYKHIKNIIVEAGERREHFLSLFEKYFDDSISIREVDNLSFHLVCEFSEERDDKELVLAFEAKGIVAHPLSKCYVGSEKKYGLILGYSCVNHGFMAQYVAKMAAVYFAKRGT